MLKFKLGCYKLRNRFCLAFFPISHIASVRKEILDFCQDEKETLGTAWARFSQLTHATQTCLFPTMCCFSTSGWG